MQISDLKNIKVAVWGLGREGASTLRVLKQKLPGQQIAVLDEKEGAEISTKELLLYEVVVLSPGISIYKDSILSAKDKGVKFTSQSNIWFSENPAIKTVCVSGTKGKSTTSSLINFFINKLGRKSVLGGNIGTPLFELCLDGVDYAVIELSSYQLASLEARPFVSLLLNLYPEHLDWHKSTEWYFRDKIRLLSLGNKSIRIVNGNDENSIKLIPDFKDYKKFGTESTIHAKDFDIYDGDMKLFSASSLKLLGKHNIGNLCAALSVLKELGFDIRQCSEYLAEFEPLPHRMCLVGEKAGIRFINDSISTIPETALAAIDTLEGSNITILLGGFDRGRDWNNFARELCRRKLINIVTMGASGTRIAKELIAIQKEGKSTGTKLYEAVGLKEAVEKALTVTKSPGVILLSPASPSYGEFKNFEERGEFFTKCVLP